MLSDWNIEYHAEHQKTLFPTNPSRYLSLLFAFYWENNSLYKPCGIKFSNDDVMWETIESF